MQPDPPIPGQTPLDDLSGLRLPAIRTRADLDAAEAASIRRAMVKYVAGRPSRRSARFDVPWIRRLHREMFGRVWSWAGELRRRETNLGSLPAQIEADLHSLAEDLRAWEASGMPLLEQAARLHHGAVRIHPFLNGNGRWARMLANIWLRLHGSEPTEWPEATIGTASVIRGEYLEAIRAADRGDRTKLIALHERFVRKDSTD
ncbi:MAG: mobile mystery protein B [Phycisphaerales bacterium]